MAEYLPFGGLRYNQAKVDMGAVLAPPYDVIKGPLREQLAQRSAVNVVEVELPAGDGDSKYDVAAALLQQWQAEGILQRDVPSFYVYEQEFVVPGGATKVRRGVLGALTLEEFGKGVQPHEHTLSGPKEDRLKLLRATQTNTSPIFGLFGDGDGRVQSVLDGTTKSPPVVETTDLDGIVHRLWQLNDNESIHAISAALEHEPVLIADGHHRYETALNYRHEQMRATLAAGREWTGSEPENAVMMMCVSVSDEGLVVLPTHRMVNADAAKIQQLLENLREHFEVQELPAGVDLPGHLAELEGGGLGRFVLRQPGHSYDVALMQGQGHLEALDANHSEAYNQLDVTLLHSLILERLLGIGTAELSAGGHVGYTIDPAEAVARVDAGTHGAAFLLRPTPVDQVRAVASAGDKMPQKSTYFYPKLITGIVLRPLHGDPSPVSG